MSASSQSPSADYAVVRKIALMGYPCVGKSSLTTKFVHGCFRDVYNSTIEDVHVKTYWFNNKKMELKITDTAGQFDFSVFPHSCSLGIHGYILVYSIDDPLSFTTMEKIYERILENTGDVVPVILVGNKLDLDSNRQITTKQGEELARKWNAPFIEISAKETENASDVFDLMLHEIEKAGGYLPQREKKCIIS